MRSRSDWTNDLKAAGIPCGAVRDVAEVLADPQLEAREMIQTVEHVTAGHVHVLGVPTKLSDTPGSVRTAPPALGQHTDAILRQDCGLSPTEIAALRASLVVS
jgi:crotonobetainyl-CoA:carnitine CoA-transferase CaiB-like acyl-CoA transferase